MTILAKLFLTLAKVGTVGFGGGLAIRPMIDQGVRRFTDITSAQFANLVGISQATPGPIAVNAATYVGFLAAGVPGALASTIGVSLPSFIIVSLVVRFIEKFKDSRLVVGAFVGIRPATIGLMASALVYVSESALLKCDFKDVDFSIVVSALSSVNAAAVIMAIATIVLAGKFKMGPIPVIAIMGAVGAVICNLPI
ncbi:MAG: chromate transporter [Bacteroidales bacterium]|nr:chromate transporter [Bacteroidales bacterium]